MKTIRDYFVFPGIWAFPRLALTAVTCNDIRDLGMTSCYTAVALVSGEEEEEEEEEGRLASMARLAAPTVAVVAWEVARVTTSAGRGATDTLSKLNIVKPLI